MKAKFISALAVSSLCACASIGPSIPPGYTGPTAEITASSKSHSSSKADLFYISHVDGTAIEDMRMATRKLNQGRGMSMTPKPVTHEVPAKPISITLVARTEYAAPILALANSVYEVKGTIEITPGPKKQYFVRGTLGEDYSAVWLEEAYTGVQIGQKIEVRGNAKLGFLEK